jgi:hypothetical protein
MTVEESMAKDEEESKPLKEGEEKKQDDKKEGGADLKENGDNSRTEKCESKQLVQKGAVKTYEPKLWLALARTYFATFMVAAVFKLGHDILLFVSPLLLK